VQQTKNAESIVNQELRNFTRVDFLIAQSFKLNTDFSGNSVNAHA
jgi:hypothetical protein